jgi:hypothetical protein
MNPYIMQMQQAQNLGGADPYFQNIAQQQANQAAAMQQGLNLTNQAGMTVEGKQAGAGYNQVAMANALRKQNQPAPVTDYSQPMSSYSGPSYGTNPNFDNSYSNTMSYD